MTWCSTVIAKMVVTNAGPIDRIAAVAAAARPFVVPRERLFGAESVKKMKAHPEEFTLDQHHEMENNAFIQYQLEKCY